MKKSLLILFILISVTCFALPRLQEVYYGDFGEVNRVVIVANQKPDYQILKSTNGINIKLQSSIKASNFKTTGKFKSKVLNGINVNQNDSGITVSLNTSKKAYFESFMLKRNVVKIVIDVFNSKTPETFRQYIDYGSFYYQMGKNAKAESIFKKMQLNFKGNDGVFLYWGKALVKAKQNKKAISMFKKVATNSKEYPLAVAELKKLGIKNIAKATKAKTKVAKKTTEDKGLSKLNTTNQVKKTEQPKLTDNEIYKAYLTAYTTVNDTSAHAFMAAVAAKTAQDYDKAIRLFKSVNPQSAFMPKAHTHLAEIYETLGNEIEAKRHRQQAPTAIAGNIGKFGIWIGILIGLGIALIFGFIKMLISKKRTNDDDDTISDFSYHEESIKKAYEAKETKEVKSDDTPKMDFDNPPIIEEPLTEKEEKQLIEDEPAVEPKTEDKQAEEDETAIMDENYKRKVVLKLAQDGWDKKDIAKELKMSTREVDFIIKIMS